MITAATLLALEEIKASRGSAQYLVHKILNN